MEKNMKKNKWGEKVEVSKIQNQGTEGGQQWWCYWAAINVHRCTKANAGCSGCRCGGMTGWWNRNNL